MENNKQIIMPPSLESIIKAFNEYYESIKKIEKFSTKDGEESFNEQIANVLYIEILNHFNFHTTYDQIKVEKVLSWIETIIKRIEKETEVGFSIITKHKFLIEGFKKICLLKAKMDNKEYMKSLQMADAKMAFGQLKKKIERLKRRMPSMTNKEKEQAKIQVKEMEEDSKRLRKILLPKKEKGIQ